MSCLLPGPSIGTTSHPPALTLFCHQNLREVPAYQAVFRSCACSCSCCFQMSHSQPWSAGCTPLPAPTFTCGLLPKGVQSFQGSIYCPRCFYGDSLHIPSLAAESFWPSAASGELRASSFKSPAVVNATGCSQLVRDYQNPT